MMSVPSKLCTARQTGFCCVADDDDVPSEDSLYGIENSALTAVPVPIKSRASDADGLGPLLSLLSPAGVGRPRLLLALWIGPPAAEATEAAVRVAAAVDVQWDDGGRRIRVYGVREGAVRRVH